MKTSIDAKKRDQVLDMKVAEFLVGENENKTRQEKTLAALFSNRIWNMAGVKNGLNMTVREIIAEPRSRFFSNGKAPKSLEYFEQCLEQYGLSFIG
ncbi:MAG: hypothetical protein KGH93_01580 [Patescibacteria group bacterium]|nr:hypothetical protein [Patescibacteria group bacterium]